MRHLPPKRDFWQALRLRFRRPIDEHLFICAFCGGPMRNEDVSGFDLPRRFCEQCALAMGELVHDHK